MVLPVGLEGGGAVPDAFLIPQVRLLARAGCGNAVQWTSANGATEDRMHDLGWLLLVVILFLLARALVRLCERLM